MSQTIDQNLLYAIRDDCLCLGVEYDDICLQQLKLNDKSLHPNKIWDLLYSYYQYGNDRFTKLGYYIDSIFGSDSGDRIKQCLCVERLREFLGEDFDEILIRRKISDLNKDTLDELVGQLQRPDLETSDWYRILSTSRIDRPTKETSLISELRHYTNNPTIAYDLSENVNSKIINNRSLTNIMLASVETAESHKEKIATLRLVAIWIYYYYKRHMFGYNIDYFENSDLSNIIEWTHDGSFYNEAIYNKLPTLPRQISYNEQFAYNLIRRHDKATYLRKLEWVKLRTNKIKDHHYLLTLDHYDVPFECNIAFVPNNRFEEILQKNICEFLSLKCMLYRNYDPYLTAPFDPHYYAINNLCYSNINEAHVILSSSYNSNGEIDKDLLEHELLARGHLKHK